MKDKIMENTIYVLITPARNEEAYIEKTIQAVISQTILPKKWVIVSDGSTDSTDEIVRKYSEKYLFIQLVRVESASNRNFSSKSCAFNAGYWEVKNHEYDFIGNLDADVSFESDYFERILQRFNSNFKLGIAGGWIHELQDGKYKERFGNRTRCVPGAIQLFRRQCYEDVGGYMDVVSEIKARMNEWEVKSFPDIKVLHHRRTRGLPNDEGTKTPENGNILFEIFRQGIIEYSLGPHPLYQLAKCFYRLREKPYILGSFFRMGGFCWAFLRRDRRIIAEDVVKYLRKEQLARIESLFLKFVKVKKG